MSNLEERIKSILDVFWDNLETLDITKYRRIYLDIKNNPHKGVPELREFFENPKGIRKNIGNILLINKLFEHLDAWENFYDEYGNYYHATIKLVERMGINLKIKGLENLDKINKNESVLYVFPHNHELEGLVALAAIGSYMHNELNKDPKMILNYLFSEIKNLDTVAFFIKNKSHKGNNREYNKKVFSDINDYLDNYGHVIHFLTETNPYWFFGMREGRLHKSFAKFAEHADKIVPVYVKFSRNSPIAHVKVVRNLFRLKDIFNKDGPCILYIGNPIDANSLIRYKDVKEMSKKKRDEYMIIIAEWMRHECNELQKKEYTDSVYSLDLLPK